MRCVTNRQPSQHDNAVCLKASTTCVSTQLHLIQHSTQEQSDRRTSSSTRDSLAKVSSPATTRRLSSGVTGTSRTSDTLAGMRTSSPCPGVSAALAGVATVVASPTAASAVSPAATAASSHVLLSLGGVAPMESRCQEDASLHSAAWRSNELPLPGADEATEVEWVVCNLLQTQRTTGGAPNHTAATHLQGM